MRDDVDSTSNLERVFVMGDSFTYGWGVELNQSYFGLINQSINSLFENIQLINMGFGGYSTGHHRKQFSLFQQQIEPKFAILFLNFTDLEDNVRQNHNYRVYDISSGIDGKIKTIPRKVYSTLKSFLLFYTPYNWLTKNSHFLVASIRLFKDIKNPKARERDDNKILGYASIPEGLTDEEIRLMSLVSLEHLEQMFIEYEKTVEKALIIWAPHRCELELIDSKPCSFPFSDFTKQVELLSRKYQNVFWLNPLNEMIVFTKGKNSEYIYFNEGHFNIKGNQLYAESIGNEVVNFFNNANP